MCSAWQEGSNHCELIEIASKIIEIGAKLSVGRQLFFLAGLIRPVEICYVYGPAQ